MFRIIPFLCVAMIAGALAGDAIASPRAVSLSDATAVPSYVRAIAPGRSVTVARQCGRGYWSETSAYRYNGSALGAQRWTSDRTLTYWRAYRAQRVTFDGITFRNGTRRTVLVAGWCS